MKELSIEEKAKAYDEAIEKAKSWHADAQIDFKKSLEALFPELKESGDERIRKWIIKQIKTYDPSNIREEALAWLEKQDKKQQKTLRWKHWKNGIAGNGEGETIYLIKHGYTYSLSSCLESECDYIELLELDKSLSEKHIDKFEQKDYSSIDPHFFKTTNKIEPKFHGDEWVVTDKNDVVQIKAVNNGYYTIDNGMDFNMPYVDRYWHKWTIQDAKAGDVLATDSWLYMFKYTNNKALIQFHCKCPINGKTYEWSFLSDDSYLDIYIDANIHPATKEQRDLLFQKMHEAGYEWNAEKKELSKIEQKCSEEDKKIINFLRKCVQEPMGTNFLGDIRKADVLAWLEKQGKEKPVEWSKEDEKMLDNIIKDVMILHNSKTIDGLKCKVNWLKSLRPRNNWKPSDEQLEALHDAAVYVDKSMFPYPKGILMKLYKQLKKLREE